MPIWPLGPLCLLCALRKPNGVSGNSSGVENLLSFLETCITHHMVLCRLEITMSLKASPRTMYYIDYMNWFYYQYVRSIYVSCKFNKFWILITIMSASTMLSSSSMRWYFSLVRSPYQSCSSSEYVKLLNT
jgi:hypothetical protein